MTDDIWRSQTWRIVVAGLSQSKKAHVLTDRHIKYGIYETLCGRQIQRENTDPVAESDWKKYNIHRCKQCERNISMSDVIKFSGGIFSNFAPWPIELDGKVWPTTEHYYQAQKAIDPAVAERIRQAADPYLAAELGRSRLFEIRKDWDLIKIEVMRKALRAKFTQHDICKNSLLATENRNMVERTDSDDYWGDGRDGLGTNYLGRLLMETRHWLRNGERDAEI